MNKHLALARKWWRQEVLPVLVFALILFSLRSSLADWNYVPSGSMKPSILEGDYILVNRMAYDLKVPFTTWHLAEWSNPQRGDIIVCYSPKDGKRLVKRAIGLPGDTIELRDEQLIINGQPMTYTSLDPSVSMQLSAAERQQSFFATEQLPSCPHAMMTINGTPALRSFGPVTVPQDQYFVMGDNRDNSFDSRFFGTVARNQILGRASAVVVSFDKDSYWLPRWNRTFSSLRKQSE